MRDLYVAIRLLNQRGTPTRLVRTGFNRPQFLEGLSADLTAHVLDLGFIAKARLPRLLGIADVLVQPGTPGPFNDYRLPSKLPEFLASGRPVVLPPTNIALEMKDGVEAIFLSSGSPEDIAGCCERIFADPALAERLGQKGAAFARRNFDLAANTAGLLRTYESALSAQERACWAVIRRSAASDLAAAASEVAEALQPGSEAGQGAPGDLASLAADLAVMVRLEDERQTGASAASDRERTRLEGALRHLEAQRDLTAVHVRNLEAQVEAQDRQLKLQKKLTDRHIQNLEARMNEIEKAARVQLEALSLENARASRENAAISLDASREHGKLVARILEMDAELRAREDRLKGIVQSRSWKLAAPLRDIERLFRGSAPAPQAAARAPENAPPAPAPGGGIQPTPIPAAQEPQTAAPAPVVHGYTFNFDHPRTWSTASSKLLVLGWCYENAGEPILAIRARFAGETIDGIYGSKRLDVLASTGMTQAEYCGVKIDIRTHLGSHTLVVEVQHDDGWHPYFSTEVHVGKAGDPTEQSEYEKWCQQHETLDDADLAAIAAHIAAFRNKPVISVVMPVYDTPEDLLCKAIQSVVDQIYPFWELCIADDASTMPHVRAVIERFAAAEPRIKTAFRPVNGHICEASNTALGLATGSYVALFDHDDTLAPSALYEVAAEVDAHPAVQVFYSDEDKIDVEDRRFDPYFKPDWNPDLISAQNYTSHLSVYRTDLVRVLGGFRKGFEGSQDWDLFLRAIGKIPASCDPAHTQAPLPLAGGAGLDRPPARGEDLPD